MIRKILFVLLLAACHHAGASCVVGNGPPGARQCTDAELNPQAALMAKAPLFIEAIRSVGHVCDRVTRVYLSNAPGIDYYHVTCDGELHYTIGVSAKRVVVWAGVFNGS